MGETYSEVPLLWVETQDGIRKPDGAYSRTVCGQHSHFPSGSAYRQPDCRSCFALSIPIVEMDQPLLHITPSFKIRYRDVQNRMLQEIIYRVGQGRGYDLLILDEAINAVSTGTLDEALLRAFVEQKPEPLELVLTGRNPPGWLIGRADYLSEICSRKHPYEQGIPARTGIEL